MHAAIAPAFRAARQGHRAILCTRNPVVARDWLEHARTVPAVDRVTYTNGMQSITFRHGGAILIRTAQGMRGHTADLVVLDELSHLEQARHVIAASRHGQVVDLNGRRLAARAELPSSAAPRP